MRSFAFRFMSAAAVKMEMSVELKFFNDLPEKKFKDSLTRNLSTSFGLVTIPLQPAAARRRARVRRDPPQDPDPSHHYHDVAVGRRDDIYDRSRMSPRRPYG